MNPSDPSDVLDELQSIDDLACLDGFTTQLASRVSRRLASGGTAAQASELVADQLDRLTSRLIDLAERSLGEPPAPYAWLSLGSHGRREQVLSSDQDSAIAYTGAPSDQGYFDELADLVVTALSRAGVPPCAGGYMATQWCRPLTDYIGLFRSWIERPDPRALLRAEVFLDVRSLRGELDVTDLHETLAVGGGRGPFTAQMAVAAVQFRPRRSWRGRAKPDRLSFIDVKTGGTAGIVLLARLYALLAGSISHSTRQRIDDAVAGGTLHRSTGSDLAEAYETLMDIRLHHQVRQFESGERPFTNLVPAASLNRHDRVRLDQALRVVAELQAVTSTRFATHTLS